MHLRVLALIEKRKDTNAELEDYWLIARVNGQRQSENRFEV